MAATEAVAFDTLRVTKSVRNGSVPMGAPSSFAPSVSMGIAAQMPGRFLGGQPTKWAESGWNKMRHFFGLRFCPDSMTCAGRLRRLGAQVEGHS
jgi:hypothetical protein